MVLYTNMVLTHPHCFFFFVISMIFFPGEMRTVAGNGTEPVRNVDEWEEPQRAATGLECGGDGYRQTNAKTEQKV